MVFLLSQCALLIALRVAPISILLKMQVVQFHLIFLCNITLSCQLYLYCLW